VPPTPQNKSKGGSELKDFCLKNGTTSTLELVLIYHVELLPRLIGAQNHNHYSTSPTRKTIALFIMKLTVAALSLAGLAAATPVELAERQSCPSVYIFGARETTVSPGYGTAGGLVNQVKAAYPGSGSEAIVYPACGGQSSCGGASYDSSASQGTAAVVKAVTAYNQKCPSTQIVVIGYSQV
jgi:hypothetical protein